MILLLFSVYFQHGLFHPAVTLINKVLLSAHHPTTPIELIDGLHFAIRATPRRPQFSIWTRSSRYNKLHVLRLTTLDVPELISTSPPAKQWRVFSRKKLCIGLE